MNNQPSVTTGGAGVGAAAAASFPPPSAAASPAATTPAPISAAGPIASSVNGEPEQHTVAIFFHIAFKAAALFIYLFGMFFVDNFVLVFVTCVILLAFDFWTVKNITGTQRPQVAVRRYCSVQCVAATRGLFRRTYVFFLLFFPPPSGRLLVGLRWWNEVLEDGSNRWIFEHKPDSRVLNSFDSIMFWGGIYLPPVVWFVMGLIALIGSFKWLLIVVIALIFSGANVIGYWKCQSDAAAKIKSFVAAKLVSAATGLPSSST